MFHRLSPNAQGVLFMTAGSLAYVVNDGLIRRATEDGLDVYQSLFLRGCLMVAILAGLVGRAGGGVGDLRPDRATVVRITAEVVATALFFAAIVHLEFANAQTILMLVPFAVTLVAARLGERVTARQYALVAVGFIGVIAVVRPTPDQFSPWTLLVVASALALVVREIATRRIDAEVRPLPVALLTAIAITMMTGTLSAFRGWGSLTLPIAGILVLACGCLIAGYLFTIEAVRVGDLSVSAPFRYTSVVGAVVVGLVLFSEEPDPLTWLGCGLIVVAGVLAAREDARVRATSAQASSHSS